MGQILELNQNIGKEELKQIIKLAKELKINKLTFRNLVMSKEEYHSIKIDNQDMDILALPYEEEYESLVLNQDIKKGEIITQDHIGFKKQLKGITKDKINLVIGKKSLYNLRKGSSITLGTIEL